ncbi:MAG: zinc ribbon domain-containing protein, partial [Deltaproteobacteria bacterium]|nr:zinc ribbon domain-containing protein [Deltaproteobacteria bacterium]
MQKFSEAPLRKCPGCGGRLTKLMSMKNFQLKGSG